MLPALMIQFVVEHTLQWSDGQFGSVARGAPLGEERSSTKPTASLQTRQSRALAICLGDEQWRGASDAEAFFERLERECRRHRVSRPELSAENLAALRQALRATGAAWRPLAPGSSLEREFPA